MQCTKPVRITKNIPVKDYPDGLLVPCGKCLACRISKRREWWIRCLHELEFHSHSIFVTLTYNDVYLPDNMSLVKKDLQKFFKRLRKKLTPMNRRIKIFACGEYGSPPKLLHGRYTIGHRPHYHAIIFGMSLDVEDKILIMESWPFCDWNNPKIRKDAFGLAESDSIRYVSQYIDKKYSGEKAVEEYDLKNREPVFRIFSPGIGRDYVDTYSEKIINNSCITVNGKAFSLPRYYIKRLGVDPEPFKQKGREKDCDLTERYTGLYMSSDDFARYANSDEEISYEEQKARARKQHEANLEAKVNLKQSNL